MLHRKESDSEEFQFLINVKFCKMAKKEAKRTSSKKGVDGKKSELEKELNNLIEENETRTEAYMKIIQEINKRINSNSK